MNGEEYAQAHDVGFDWTSNGYHQDETGWEHQRFTVELSTKTDVFPTGIAERFTWRQGMGIYGEPSVGDVLYALVRDAQAGEQSFDDFCWEYGYDTDSRKAYGTWEQCQATGEQLRRLFGEIPDVDEEG